MRDTIENIRMIATTCLSYAFGWLMPTKGFVLALVLMFAFNCFCGMRADGVHPAEFEPYQDMASNIGHELSKYYDIAYNQE